MSKAKDWSEDTDFVRDAETKRWQMFRHTRDGSTEYYASVPGSSTKCGTGTTHAVAFSSILYKPPSEDPAPESPDLSFGHGNQVGWILEVQRERFDRVGIALISAGETSMINASEEGMAKIIKACPQGVCLEKGLETAMRKLRAEKGLDMSKGSVSVLVSDANAQSQADVSDILTIIEGDEW